MNAATLTSGRAAPARIDFLATVAPGSGLAEGYAVRPPSPPDEPQWRTLVRLCTSVAEDGPGLSSAVVGAYGVNRADSLVRGVGEAVERFALRPGAPFPGAVHGTATDVAAHGDPLPFHEPHVALGDPAAAGEPFTWYPARRLRDGAAVLVPAGVVDSPGDPGTGFDTGPSGAASGQGLDMATRSALLEVIERDAFGVAWEGGLALPRVDPDRAGVDRTDGVGRRERRTLDRLRREAAGLGLRLHAALLPTAVPGVVGIAGVVEDPSAPAPLLTVGAKAAGEPLVALRGALQEALQLRSAALGLWAELDMGGPAPDEVTDDNDRLRLLASRPGHESVRRWVAGFGDAVTLPAPAEPTVADLVRGVVADGGDPVVVDLTHRLPAPLREMDWAAVKVVPVGYQPLRLDERMAFTRNRARLDAAAARSGLPVAASIGPDGLGPHPLP